MPETQAKMPAIKLRRVGATETESLMRRLYRKSGGSRITITYDGGRFYAHRYPSHDQARQLVQDEIKDGVTLKELTDAINTRADRSMSVGGGITIADALKQLSETLKPALA